MKTNTVMKKNEKYMVKPLNEKEQRNVSGGFVDTRSPLDILNEEKLNPFKKPRKEDFTKFW